MIEIIGTSHIAKESIEEIKRAINERNPQVIAIELDTSRAAALMSNQKSKLTVASVMKIGIKGFLFAKIGQFVQQKLGKIVGVDPGTEMKTALEIAKKKKLDIALIDQPLEKTLKEFSKNITLLEKLRFIADLAKSPFQQKKQLKELGLSEFDLKKVPSTELIEKMMSALKIRYPSIHKTLVEDRNKYMVKQLVKIMRTHPEKKILAIVGAGHKKGMEELLLKVDVV
ncbi:TraB/GumN family protein [Candidatus Woesearchaeota archaeon]|nr:TraB/GumN family protein [Candidatus Woesearchaeota archaeon]